MASSPVLSGPTADTQAGDVVIVTIPPDMKYGVAFIADTDGCAAVVQSFERVQNGKFGPIQKHGGIHQGDVLFELNDISLMNTKYEDVVKMLSDRNVLKRELKFMNSKEYYRRK